MTTNVRSRVVSDFDAADRIGIAVRQCWLEVSNAGGAVGFPFIPVSAIEVDAATQRLARDVAAGSVVLFVAESAGDVVGWVSLRLNASVLTKHWATVERLQSRPDQRGLGIGGSLMQAVTEHALAIGLEQLQLVLRGGMRLEGFYEMLGWKEIGRHPAALRLADGDDRDEVSMMLNLTTG